MFDLFEGMKRGNKKQRDAYTTIKELCIFDELSIYNPMLCGTIPIGIDLDNSDLDIVMDVKDLRLFEKKLDDLYGNKSGFTMRRTIIRSREVVKAKFLSNNFELELFGQDQSIYFQNAYLHMIIEYELLKNNPTLKDKVIELKKQGYKTEPAFCKLLGIAGDPYIGLVQYGIKERIINL
ncbi:protein of unknown function [Halobacillus alkaliphilus]|uniref:DUF4269 domain-containing protein n=1 Tax=Halobacillus alkaliphilus TaxID=396056 RepID=A0A1I2JZA5_9BACI|nr:DUF4269 domain-containing protein [Halobacillus alkaliphilus]SFF58066.1 protein of unknown function [Halobacillus alkaliphilus]